MNFSCNLIRTGLLAVWLGYAPPLMAWPHIEPVPGGVAAVTLPASATAPVAFYQERRVWVRPEAGAWVALVGIPLDTPPGLQQLTRPEAPPIAFVVQAKHYPEQRLTVKNQRHVNPSAADLTRIQAESLRTKAALAQFRSAPALREAWPLPTRGRLSSPFGLRRYFNGEARKPHSGLDIAAPTGTPVYAPASGIVTLTGDFFFNGQCLLLDHGQGLISAYMHLDHIAVASEQVVQAGERLGAVGSTGRATGPHLHWGVYLNQTAIDPHYFVADSPTE